MKRGGGGGGIKKRKMTGSGRERGREDDQRGRDEEDLGV